MRARVVPVAADRRRGLEVLVGFGYGSQIPLAPEVVKRRDAAHSRTTIR